MSRSEQKVVQYLGEAHASEIGVLRSQIAITPRGSYRDGLEKHLAETRKHAGRIQQRLGEVHGARNPLQVIVGLTETLVSQTLAVSKPPWPGYDEITAAEIEAGSSRATSSMRSKSSHTSGPTRTGLACSRPPSARPPTPEIVSRCADGGTQASVRAPAPVHGTGCPSPNTYTPSCQGDRERLANAWQDAAQGLCERARRTTSLREL